MHSISLLQGGVLGPCHMQDSWRLLCGLELPGSAGCAAMQAGAGLQGGPLQRTLGTEDWLGMTIMRIQRPSTRSVFTVLKLCEPPFTCAGPV